LFGFLLVMGMFWWACRPPKNLAGILATGLKCLPYSGVAGHGAGACDQPGAQGFICCPTAYQTLILGVLGYIAYWQRNINEPAQISSSLNNENTRDFPGLNPKFDDLAHAIQALVTLGHQ